jgi:hypothetical protein
MKEHFVIDPLISKRQQLLLATQLCRMVLKVCTSISFVTRFNTPSHLIALPVVHSTGCPCFIPCSSSLAFGEAGKRHLFVACYTRALCMAT